MNKKQEEALLRHVRGQIVQHRSPFSDIDVPMQPSVLSQDEIDCWVAPIYLKVLNLGMADVEVVRKNPSDRV